MQDDLLVASAVAGDAESLERLLFDRYDRLAGRTAQRISPRFRGVIDADDVLQSAFVDAFRDIGRLAPPTAAAFDAWLLRIIENRLLDAVKALRRKKRGGDMQRLADDPRASSVRLLEQLQGEGLTASREVAQDEALSVMQQALKELPEEYAEVIRLRHLLELSEDEAARRMGRTPDAVRGLSFRARKKLREVMGRTSLYF